jgi:hypothetical protein
VEPPATKPCANCGAELALGAEFCANCGSRVPAEEAGPPLTTAASPATESAFQVIGKLLAIISAMVLGVALCAVVGGAAMSLAVQSKPAALAAASCMIVVVALLVLLILAIERGRVRLAPTLSIFLITVAVVLGGGLSICSAIALLPVFGK